MSSSDALKWLNENFNFVDSVTIIDHSGTIIRILLFLRG